MVPNNSAKPQVSAIDPIALERSGFAMEKAGAKGEADAIGAQGKEEAQALDSAQTSMAIEQANYQKKLGEYQTQRDGLEKDIRDGKLDPNRYMDSLSTGSRMLAGISIILGGLGGGLTGKGGNTGLDVINRAIDRDIDAQKTNSDKTQNLYRMNLEKTRDLNAATMQTQTQMLSIAKVRIEQAAAKYKDPMAQSRAQQMLGGITEKQSALETQLAQLYAQNYMVNGASGGQGVPLSPYVASNKDMAERLVPLSTGSDGRPLYRMAASKEGADKVKELQGDSQTVLQNLAKMRSIAAKPANILSPTEQKIFKASATQIAPMFGKIAGVNRFNMDEANMNKDSFGSLNGGIITGQTLEQLDNASDYVKRAVENVRGQHILNYQAPYKNPSAVPYGKK